MLKKASRTLKPVLLSKTLDKNSYGNSSVESLGNNSKRFTISKSPSSKRDLSHGSDSNTSVAISPCIVNRDESSPVKSEEKNRFTFSLEFQKKIYKPSN